MGKKIKAGAARGPGASAQLPVDDGGPEEVSISDDPELASPPSAKSKVQLAFEQQLKEQQQRQYQQVGQNFSSLEVPFGPDPGAGWKALLNVLVIFPWTLVLLLSWLVNKWQLLFRPLGAYLWWIVDKLDQKLPSVVEFGLWFWGLLSLALHVITIGINLGVIWILWDNGHRIAPFVIVAFYFFSHYCMAVLMFKELDLREAGGTYFSDVMTFLQRILDVLFFDIQLAASVVHSNRMLTGTTQLMFKGYEEARVALTTLLFTIPCCILMGVEYGVFMKGRLVQDLTDLDVLNSYQDQLYAAVCFSVINSLEKLLRLSLVDPWLHPPNDGFPLLYVRSHAARLPGGLVRDWEFRCRMMLLERAGKLELKELYGHYTSQVKEAAYGLSDPHKAYLLRKAMHVFNTSTLYEAKRRAAASGEAPVLPGAQGGLVAGGRPMITALYADNLAPGEQLCHMLADILAGASGLHTLSLAGNQLDDSAVVRIMEALHTNDTLVLQLLDLSGNLVCHQGANALAEVLGSSNSIYSLNLARCPLRDDGAAALAEALKSNIGLYRLDLSHTAVGPEGGCALANALRSNTVLGFLDLSGSRIGGVGCEAIAKALRSNTTLKDLDISHTNIDDKAAGALAAMLSVNKGLERLVMTHTNVTDGGAQLICNALQSNTTLQLIDVSNNMCMDKSWQKLLNHVVKGKAKN